MALRIHKWASSLGHVLYLGTPLRSISVCWECFRPLEGRRLMSCPVCRMVMCYTCSENLFAASSDSEGEGTCVCSDCRGGVW